MTQKPYNRLIPRHMLQDHPEGTCNIFKQLPRLKTEVELQAGRLNLISRFLWRHGVMSAILGSHPGRVGAYLHWSVSFPHLEVGYCGFLRVGTMLEISSQLKVWPHQVCFEWRADLLIPVLLFHRAQVDVLAAFLDDAEGAGLSDESFVALMDRPWCMWREGFDSTSLGLKWRILSYTGSVP